MVSLVVACGGGIFTTTIVADEIKEILKKAGIQHKVSPAKLTEIAGITDADLIVVTGKFGAKKPNAANIPILIGMALLTGVGKDKFAEELVQKVREIETARKQ
jgi:PTS system galactitol-specific IIB component